MDLNSIVDFIQFGTIQAGQAAVLYGQSVLIFGVAIFGASILKRIN